MRTTRPVAREAARASSDAAPAASSRTLSQRLLAPIDCASIVFFRLAFGVLMLWEVWYYASHGFVAEFWIKPSFHFKYLGFEWVQPWPGQGMYWHFAVLALLALSILLGAFYRLGAALFCAGLTYVFLIEEARYLNHFYLACLVSFLLAWIPAHRSFSLDARWRPSIRSATVPAWTLYLLRAQFGLVYFYGGIAKLNGDWLQGEPMRYFLQQSSGRAVIGSLLDEAWVTYLFAYGGLLLDLLVVPLLLWKRTRVAAFLFALAFHLTNAWLFTLDIFPWFMIAATALFFPPDWPRRAVRFIVQELPASPDTSAPPAPPRWHEHATLAALGVYLAIQVLVPLRSFLYPGNVLWTNEGERFSWRMMLREKRAETWFAVANLETNQHVFVDPRLLMPAEKALEMYHDPQAIHAFADSLVKDWAPKQGWKRVSVKKIDSFLRFSVVPAPGSPRQNVDVPRYLTLYQQEKMSWYPDCILQLAHRLRDEQRAKGFPEAQVFVEAWVSLNGRRHQQLVDPEVDLAAEVRSLAPCAWILPLKEPLRP